MTLLITDLITKFPGPLLTVSWLSQAARNTEVSTILVQHDAEAAT